MFPAGEVRRQMGAYLTCLATVVVRVEQVAVQVERDQGEHFLAAVCRDAALQLAIHQLESEWREAYSSSIR